MVTFSAISTLANSFKSIRRSSSLHTFASGLDPSASLLSLLDLSIETHSLNLVQQSHAKAQRLGLTQHALIAQKLILLCCQLGKPFDAKLVFDSVLVKNVHICNTLLSGYGKNQIFHESFALFREMCNATMLPLPDDFTFSVMFKVLGDFAEVWIGRMVHARGLTNGFLLDIVVGNSLLSMYGRSECFDDAFKVFDEMPLTNVRSWNTLISCYAKVYEECSNPTYRLWDLVKEMQNQGLKLDAITMSTLLSTCGHKCGRHGRELHCYIIKNGLYSNSDDHLGCCLIGMYSKMGKVNVARRAFDGMNTKNIIARTAMINGYVLCGDFDEALSLFREMQWGGMGANKVSLVTVLPACGLYAGLNGVKQIHGFAVRKDLNHKQSLCNALIDAYAKCGSLKYAAQVFDHECIDPDAISWSSIICGYGLHGNGQRAVLLFDEMILTGIKPDPTVVIGVLSACSRSGLVNDGIRIYDTVVTRYKMNPTVEMCSCVVDMLSRSGQFDQALQFIKSMKIKPRASVWGALLCAAVQHGSSEMQELAYTALIAIEPDNSSNYVSISNLYAASKRWDVVARVRKVMKQKGLRKVPGCSWISINSTTHSFVVGDKSHPCSDMIYVALDELVSTMKSCDDPEFVSLIDTVHFDM